MAISPETLELIRTKVDLVELVREYLPNLRETGRNFKVLCPFHAEKTPSFIVSPEKGLFHCFGCGVGGDIFGFLMRMENVTFFEAVKKLARRCGIEIKNEDQWEQNIQEKNLFRQLYEEASSFYHQCLLESKEAKLAREYLEKRNIFEETIKEFCLGYAPQEGEILKKLLEEKGYPLEQPVKAGLVNYSEAQKKHYDYFRGRLIFPIFDLQGRVIAFGGRLLDKEKDVVSQSPKYLNSPETLIFSKGKVLYGLFQANKAICSEKQAIILEGYFDVLALHQAGIENAVASLGTALTPEQMQLLRRYTNKILLIFDSDRAGIEAMQRSSEIISEIGKVIAAGLPVKNIEIVLETDFEVLVATLPEGCDADEILQSEGKKFFLSLLEKAKDFIEFQIELAISKYGLSSYKNKVAIAKEILPLIIKIKDTLEEQVKIRYLAEKLDLDEEMLNIETKRLKRKRGTNSFLEETKTTNNSPEEELLGLLFREPKLVDLVIDKLEPKDFLYPQFTCLAEIIFNTGKELNWGKVVDLLGEEYVSWISKLACEGKQYRDKKKVVTGLVNTIQRRQRERRWKNLAEEIKSMLEGEVPFDQTKYKEYQELTKNLKGS